MKTTNTKRTPGRFGVTSASYYTHTFHGVLCTKLQFARWVSDRVSGKCPWCKRAFGARYGNLSHHLLACDKRPLHVTEARAALAKAKGE